MRLLYSLLIALIAPLALLALWRRSRAPGAAAARPAERFGAAPRVPGGVAVWVHAASVGELVAATPLIEALLERHGDRRVAVTTMTASASAQLTARWAGRIPHAYLPFDLPGVTGRFLDRLAPQQAVILEAELWPNLYAALARRRIPLTLANARMSPRSFARFSTLHALVAPTFRRIGCVAAQSAADAQRYRALGAPQVAVIGNLKFDCHPPADQVKAGERLRAQLGAARPVWVAASTHDPEEQAAIQAHQQLQSQFPDAVLILVPRHPQRFAAVATAVQRSGLRWARRSDGDAPADTQILLGDSLGEMFMYLAAADAVFVGGSLADVGGHNILEPAALARPVLHGPHMHNFRDSEALLGQARAARQVSGSTELRQALVEWFGDPAIAASCGAAGKAALADHQGATRRLLALLARAIHEGAR